MRRASTARRRVEQVVVEDDGAARRARRDVLATEEPLEIRVAVTDDLHRAGLDDAAVPVSVTMRTPGADFELAAGFLYTEGLIGGADAISSIRYCTSGEQQYNVVSVVLAPGTHFDPSQLQRNFYQTSSCGVCGKASIEAVLGPACARVESGLTISPEVVTRLPETLRAAQAVFERTGGLHAAGLFTGEGELVVLREDVGRHNAVDKVVGWAFERGLLPLRGHVLQVSGRASFELVQKAWTAGVPVLAAVSAPSSLAVDLAVEAGLTLVGFSRGESFNVYAGAHRIS